MRAFAVFVAALALWFAAPAAQAGVLPTAPEVVRLPNGLTVVLVPWDSPGMVAYYSVVRAGSRDETDPGHTGFAHLFEHLMFRGTERFPKDAYEAKIQEFGADNNAFTSYDLTCYTVEVPTAVLPELIEIEADRFRNLEFGENDFKTETGAVLGEYNLYSANPGLEMDEKLRVNAFEKHPYGHTVIGFLADVKAMPGYYDYSRRFHHRFYTPDNTTLVVVGDYDRGAVLAKIEAEYGAWKGKRRAARAKVEPEQTAPRSVHVPWSGPTAPKMAIAYKIPAFAPDKDSAALLILSNLLFHESSPLYQKLVVEEQKVVELYASYPFSRDPYLLEVDATLREGTAFGEVEEAVAAAVAEVASGAADPARIAAVKSYTRYDLELSLEKPKDVAYLLARIVSATGDVTSLDEIVAALDAVTPEDVAAAAKAYLKTERRTTVTMAHAEQGGAK